MKRLLLLLSLVVPVAVQGQMHTVPIFPDVNPPGSAITVAGGVRSYMYGNWRNDWGQNIYIWGAQADLWTNLANPPAGSLNASGWLPAWGQAADLVHYLQNIADLNVQVTVDGIGQIRGWGSDHYDNAPGLNGPPVFFPKPFILGPGGSIHLIATGANGYQASYGGSFTLNADALIYYTVGQP